MPHERSAVEITQKQLRAKLIEQNYRCALTGALLTPENATPDHIVPVTKGGSHSIENIQIVTEEANRAKGELTMEEFRSLCARVLEWTARTNGSEPVAKRAGRGD